MRKSTAKETLNARVMFVGDYSAPSLVTMEITSEKDLFLCYRFRCKDGGVRSDPEYEYYDKIKND